MINRPLAIAVCCVIAVLFIQGISNAQLRVVTPNGGERLAVGTKETITWAGIPANRMIVLEYSTDDGASWIKISTQASGLQYLWTVPSTPGIKCLLRATLPGRVFSDSVLADGVPHAGAPATFMWSPTGNSLGIGTANDVLSANDLHVQYHYPTNNGPNLAYTPNGKTVFFQRNDSVVDVIDLASQQVVRQVKGDFKYGLIWLGKDENHFLALGSHIVRYDSASGLAVDVIKSQTLSSAFFLDFNVAQNRVAVAFGDTTPYAVMYDLTSGDSLYTMNTGEPCSAVAMNTDGSLVATFGTQQSVKIWDVKTGNLVNTLPMPTMHPASGPGNAVFSWAPVAPFNILAVATGHDSIVIWNVQSGSITYTVQCNGSQPFDMSYHPGDGKWLVANAAGILYVFDARTGTLLQEYDFKRPTIGGPQYPGDGDMVWSPDATRLAVRDAQGRVGILYFDPTDAEQDFSDTTFSIIRIAPANLILRAGNASARQNETVKINLIISDPAAAISTGATQITAVLRFDNTMLVPQDPTPSGSLTGPTRTITLTLPVTSPTDSILASFPFWVTLGNDSITTLEIVSSTPNTPLMTLTNIDGNFKLLNLCTQGGARLINPNGAATISAVSPNPSSSDLTFTINSIELGRSRVQLTDTRGAVIKVFADGELPLGESSYHFSVHDMPCGSYFLVLETPTTVQRTMVEITR